MNHRHLGSVALAAAFAGVTAPAQRTWIVDANNGPGTHFTDLPAAFGRAAGGDTVIVRAGSAGVPVPAQAGLRGESLTIQALLVPAPGAVLATPATGTVR